MIDTTIQSKADLASGKTQPISLPNAQASVDPATATKTGSVAATASGAPTADIAPGAALPDGAVRATPVRTDINALNTPPSDNSFQSYEDNKKLSPEDTKNISDTYTQQLRDEMDLINAQYNAKNMGQLDANTAAAARVKALNANQGTVDSGTGESAVAATETKGRAAMDNIEATRTAALSTATDKIDALKTSALNAAQSQKNNDFTNYQKYQADTLTNAKAGLTSLLAGGSSLETLKNAEPQSYQSLVSAFGGEEELKAAAITLAPQASFVSNTPVYNADKTSATFFQKGPNGTISPVTIALPASTNKTITKTFNIPGEGVYVTYSDGTHEIMGTGKKTTTKDTTVAYTNGKTSITKADVSAGQAHLDSIRGTDNFVDPYKYKDMYTHWTDQGLNANDFTKAYPPKNYINPTDNKLLPPNLRTRAPAAASSAGA